LGELRPDEVHRWHAHVSTCSVCSERFARDRDLLATIARPPVDLSPAASFVARVGDALGQETDARRASPRAAVARWPRWAAAAAIIAVGLGLMTQLGGGHREPTWASRGGRRAPADVGAAFLVTGEHGVESIGARSLGPRDALAVRYWNRTGTTRYLMAFGIDAAGEVHWLYPPYESSALDPASVPINPGPPQLLSEVVAPDGPAPGPFRLVTLITNEPLHVKGVETVIRSGKVAVDIAFRDAVVSEQLTLWEVLP
jgi:hypothetical protein